MFTNRRVVTRRGGGGGDLYTASKSINHVLVYCVESRLLFGIFNLRSKGARAEQMPHFEAVCWASRPLKLPFWNT